MKKIIRVLESIWNQEIPKIVSKGLITYERQLQAELYYLLRNQLREYHIWVEPSIYLSEEEKKLVLQLTGKRYLRIIPDLVITKGSQILSVIELKFKPWEYPTYKTDLEKLFIVEKVLNSAITFGYEPISHDWKTQSSTGKKSEFYVAPNFTPCFIVFGKPESAAFNLQKVINKPKRLLQLSGHISKAKVKTSSKSTKSVTY